MKQIEVVAAIIRKGDKIYATQLGYGERKDWWELPSGKIKLGTILWRSSTTSSQHVGRNSVA